jgi:hypothetical protein
MNERIRELAKQATIHNNTEHHIDIPVWYVQRFAELIVRECIGCCEQVISDTVPKSIDTFEQGGIHCMDEIKQHFGVEE